MVSHPRLLSERGGDVDGQQDKGGQMIALHSCDMGEGRKVRAPQSRVLDNVQWGKP
jgi:hypothetical protein